MSLRSFLFFFRRRCLPASPPGPSLSGLIGSELEDEGLLSSIEPRGEWAGAAEGGGFYKRRNQSHSVLKKHKLPDCG